ncbi:MAG: hypothetical protein QXO51_00170 [Halobacteria archaeon]
MGAKKAAAKRPAAGRAAPKKPSDPVAQVFLDMKRVFVPGKLRRDATYYFSIGEGNKWTVVAGPKKVVVKKGKLTENADCVLKADRGMFLRMIHKGYIPNFIDFQLGFVKTNRPEMLAEFGKAFKW